MVVVAAALVAARFSQGAIDLSYFKPQIEAALSSALGGGRTAMQRLSLEVSDGRIALSAFGVEAAAPTGETTVRARRVDVRLDPSRLLLGEIRARGLEIIGARLTATRDESGAMQLIATGDPTPESHAAGTDITSLVRAWLTGNAAFDGLPDIRLRNATLVALDGATGETLWRGHADASATLTANHAVFWAEIGLDDKRATVPLRLSATLTQLEGGEAALTFAKAKLGAVARVARLFGAELPPMEGVLDGSARIAVGPDLTLLRAEANLQGEALESALPSGRQANVDHIELEAQYDATKSKISINGLRMGPGPTATHGAGLIAAGSLELPTTHNADTAYRLSGRVDHGDISYIAGLAGMAPLIAGIDASVAADFDLTYRDGVVTAAETRIVGKGTLTRADLFHIPLQVERAEAFLTYRPNPDTVTVKGFDAVVAGVHASGEATAGLDDALALDTLTAKVLLDAFSSERLTELWPKTFSPGGRAWVARNLLKGQVSGADIVATKAHDGPVETTGAFSAEGVDVRYWDPMPIATDVVGTGRFAGDTLELAVTHGVSGGMSTKDVKVEFVHLGAPTEYIVINGLISGPAPKLLAILDREPLRYAQWLGVAPEATKGDVTGRLKMKFPLIDAITVDDLEISAEGHVTNAVLPKAVNGWDLAAKSMRIDVNTKRLNVDGDGELLNEPLRFAGDLNFGKGSERARFKGTWLLTRDVRRALGLGDPAIRRRLTGVTPAAFDIVIRPDNIYEIDVDADLSSATLLAQEIGWLKPKGAPARLKAKAIIQNDKPFRIDDIDLSANDLALQASIGFNPLTGALERIAVQRLRGVGHDLAADIALDGAFDRVRIYGRKADLRPLLESDRSAAPATPETLGEAPEPPRERRFQIDLEQAAVSDLLTLDAVKAGFTLIDSWPTAMQAGASYPGGLLTLGPDPEKLGALRMTASDFGRLLAAAGATEGVVGGDFYLIAFEQPDTGYGLEVHSRNFDFKKSVITELAGESSTKLITLFNGGDAVRFDRLDMFARYSDGAINIDKSSADGAALGISAHGKIDRRGRTLDISGAIAPAYAVSRALGGIPILGQILTGSKREGLFAANYRASGSLDDPKFNVNPLSALAPGILREIFGPGVAVEPGSGQSQIPTEELRNDN